MCQRTEKRNLSSAASSENMLKKLKKRGNVGEDWEWHEIKCLTEF